MRRRSRLLILALGMAGCSSGPSHIPPLWQLPGAAVSSVVGNTLYDARRREVARLVTLHDRALAIEIDADGGPKLSEAMDAAQVSLERRAVLLDELQKEPHIYRRAGDRGYLDIEAVTVALMVYGR